MEPDFDHSPTPPEPMACSEPPPVHRDDVFKELLLKLSHKMSQDNAHELSFMAESGLPGTTTPLEVLIELQKQGVFSPRLCANLEGHLRKINRCDLADIVRQYMDAYPVTEPSPSGKRESSFVYKMVESLVCAYLYHSPRESEYSNKEDCH